MNLFKRIILKPLLPDFVFEMADQIATQPNRCTAHPFWQVRYKEWRPVPDDFGDEFQIFDCNDSISIYASYSHDEDYKDYLWENYQEWCESWAIYENDEDYESPKDCFFDIFSCDGSEFPDGVEKYRVEQFEQIASTHFTEHDANWFIERKQHDYPKLYTYVESAYWSPQVRKLQDWLRDLSGAKQ